MNRNSGVRLFLVWLIALLVFAGWWFTREPDTVASRVRETYPLGDSIPLDRLEGVDIELADGRLFRMIVWMSLTSKIRLIY